MDIASWWSRLSSDDRRYLIENNGDEVPEDRRLRLVEAGAEPGSPEWWAPVEGDPSRVELADRVVDWIETVANGEVPRG